MNATLADVPRQFGPAYLATHLLSTPQAKAWRAIVACCAAALALGGYPCHVVSGESSRKS